MSLQLHALTTQLVPFAVAYFMLAMVPGPNFAVVANASLNSDRSDVLRAAFGIATGAGLLSAFVSLGAGSLLSGETTRRLLALIFGTYLIFLALRSWSKAATLRNLFHLSGAVETRGRFRLAFLTAIANPVTAMFVASASPPYSSRGGWALIAVTVFLVAIGWFGLVGLSISMLKGRSVNQRWANLMNMTFGAIFMVLGVAMVLSGS
ncbi:LysE family translocator [Pararhizobium qamdonense]|uniref:LysE family translocator n=1 Tax=Pararhizobium qamdonense TaxID=3031126 RepID=UPI0023E33037|nr:LysE family transporter [Pararhizobium qamdonense]